MMLKPVLEKNETDIVWSLTLSIRDLVGWMPDGWVGFYQLITPLPTKMLCCSSFSLFNRSGLFFFALSAIVEVLSLLLSDSRHKICSCSCSKIISLRPPLLIVCTLGNRLFTTLGTRCWLFIFALCSFVLRVITWSLWMLLSIFIKLQYHKVKGFRDWSVDDTSALHAVLSI